MALDVTLRNPGPTFNVVLVDPPSGNPFLVLVRGVDARTLEIWLSEPVVESEITNPANFAVVGPGSVSVLSVEKLAGQSYRLKTTEQARNASYTLQISNVHDLAGNPT